MYAFAFQYMMQYRTCYCYYILHCNKNQPHCKTMHQTNMYQNNSKVFHQFLIKRMLQLIFCNHFHSAWLRVRTNLKAQCVTAGPLKSPVRKHDATSRFMRWCHTTPPSYFLQSYRKPCQGLVGEEGWHPKVLTPNGRMNHCSFAGIFPQLAVFMRFGKGHGFMPVESKKTCYPYELRIKEMSALYSLEETTILTWADLILNM